MKRAAGVVDLSGSESPTGSPPKKKTFLEQVSNKLPSFKIPKKSKSPVKSARSREGSPDSRRLDTVEEEGVPGKSGDVVAQLKKRSRDGVESDLTERDQPQADPSAQSSTDPSVSNAELARQHYNSLKQVSMNKRHESKIFNLRGFNNYVKSSAITDFLSRLGALGKGGATVLDLGCGKGGDLRKWGLARPAHVVCVDIADVSVQQCRERYAERPRELTFKANFIVADCTRDNLDDKYREENIPDVEFDLVSCQFVLHYGFESQAQAKTMIRNAVSRLKPGCFFFGTTPRSDYLVKKYRALSEGTRFGNDVFYVDFKGTPREGIPLFGAQYVFYLDGAVEELAEYLIHFPLLQALLEEEGCECVLAQPFPEYIYKEGELRNVGVLSRTRGLNDAGTLPQQEWEVVACYMVFGFRKLTDEERETKRNNKRRKVDT